MIRNMYGEPVTLIGITGKAGAGKDTFAWALADDAGFYVRSFAAPIKEMLNTLLDIAGDEWSDRDWKERTLGFVAASPRKLAQTLGTEWGRQCIDPDLWVKIAMHQIMQGTATRIVIPDVRFENEALLIREHGQLLRIIRPNSGLSGETAAHVSEAGVRSDDRDVCMLNIETVDKFERDIALWIEASHSGRNTSFSLRRGLTKLRDGYGRADAVEFAPAAFLELCPTHQRGVAA